MQAATTNPPATSEELAEASISEDYTYVYLIVASDKHASDGSSSGDAAMTAMMDQQKAKVKGTDHPNFKVLQSIYVLLRLKALTIPLPNLGDGIT